MNIEAERKAFEAIYPNAAALDFAEGVYKPFPQNQSIWSQKVADHANKLFPVWVAAKEHAAEMAKPVAEVYERMDDRFWAVKEGTRNNVCENGSTFECYSDAVALAKERGYRVVEE